MKRALPLPTLTHLAPGGRALRMVDVAPKQPTPRTATARGRVVLSQPAAGHVLDALSRKGPVAVTAQIAGTLAAKRTAELIPLCHTVPLDHVGVSVSLNPEASAVDVKASVSCTARTGVEMEAIVAVSVAAAAVYDMLKSHDRHMVIDGVRVVRKQGGNADFVLEGEQADKV